MTKILNFIIECLVVVLVAVSLVFGGMIYASERNAQKLLEQHQTKIQLKSQIITE